MAKIKKIKTLCNFFVLDFLLNFLRYAISITFDILLLVVYKSNLVHILNYSGGFSFFIEKLIFKTEILLVLYKIIYNWSLNYPW